MATSQNGYPANDRSLIGSYTVPGTTGKVAVRKGDVATILLYVLQRYNREVEKLVWPGVWGYAERTIRGSSTTLSNHASGTAVDANAPKHPLGTHPKNNYTTAQIARIHAILNACHVDGRPVVRWGGDYINRKDGMHFEIVGSPGDVHTLAVEIRNIGVTPVVPSNKKKVQTFQRTHLEFAASRCDGIWGKDTEYRATRMRNVARNGNKMPGGTSKATIKLIQRIVDVPDNGTWDARSTAAMKLWVSKFQTFLGVNADGDWGPKTDAAYLAFRKANLKL